MPPVQVRAAGLAYVRSTRAWQLAENHRATWKSTIFSLDWVRGVTRSVHMAPCHTSTRRRLSEIGEILADSPELLPFFKREV